MTDWQVQYIKNAHEILMMTDFSSGIDGTFDAWYQHRKDIENKIVSLRKANNTLLESYLFPLLDNLDFAGEEERRGGKECGGGWRDWG